MKTLLCIDSSGRVTRSVTRNLTARFVAAWRRRHPDGLVIQRDVGLAPPPPVDEAWIAAANAPTAPVAPEALRVSDELIAELRLADAIVVGVPMYNFGMPAQLKAWVDQVVRINKTFAFDPAAADPYRGLLQNKPVVLLISVGDGDLLPGGPLEHMNHLEPHLRTVLAFVGLTDLTFVRAGYDEYQDDRTRRSVLQAEAQIERIVERLSSPSEADAAA